MPDTRRFAVCAAALLFSLFLLLCAAAPSARGALSADSPAGRPARMLGAPRWEALIAAPSPDRGERRERNARPSLRSIALFSSVPFAAAYCARRFTLDGAPLSPRAVFLRALIGHPRHAPPLFA